jgi:hypothetical protein
MVQYLLRAEDLHHENPWAASEQRWHVARVGAVFAICTRLLEPATSVRPKTPTTFPRLTDARRAGSGHSTS